jgi:hypothetical protein
VEATRRARVTAICKNFISDASNLNSQLCYALNAIPSCRYSPAVLDFPVSPPYRRARRTAAEVTAEATATTQEETVTAMATATATAMAMATRLN